MFGWAKPVPYNPYNLKNQRWGEAFVAGAGPGVNILLAVGFGLFIRFFGAGVPGAFVEFASIIVFVNIMLAVFNLIPIPPLDGSKLLKSVLPWNASMVYQRLENFMAQGGLFMVLIFFWILLSLIGPYLGSALMFLFTAITGVTM
jgi:Zn-dependent protease